jgi:uncharacterized protein YegL
VHCATHAARFELQGDALLVAIDRAMLDRDLVLAFELRQDLAPSARVIVDGEEFIGMLSLVLPAAVAPPRPLNLCLVLDGSGSMQGDAIEQSRAALRAVIDEIGDADRIQVIRFGSTASPLFRRPLRTTPVVRKSLSELVATINADLGGTEMREALRLALAQVTGAATPDASNAIILVTDGAVQPADVEEARHAAIAAGVRIFVVAVGSSAGTEVLEPLAVATGATLERAVPAEPIQACVMRQFRRSRATTPLAVSVTWPGPTAATIATPIAYPGDALQWAAVLPRALAGEVVVAADGIGFVQRIALAEAVVAPALRALLGQQRYRNAPPAGREALALRYGLLTAETAAVLVKLRAAGDKLEELPLIVQVPQMLPEGMMIGAAPMLADMSLAPMKRSMPRGILSPPAAASAPMPADARSLLARGGGGNDITGRFQPGDFLAKAVFERKERQPTAALPPARVREILLTLRAALADLVDAQPRSPLTIDAAIARLAAPLRADAATIADQLGIDRTSHDQALYLLLCLGMALGIDDSDESEAKLSALAARLPQDIVTPERLAAML